MNRIYDHPFARVERSDVHPSNSGPCVFSIQMLSLSPGGHSLVSIFISISSPHLSLDLCPLLWPIQSGQAFSLPVCPPTQDPLGGQLFWGLPHLSSHTTGQCTGGLNGHSQVCSLISLSLSDIQSSQSSLQISPSHTACL